MPARFSASLTLMFSEAPFQRRFGAARAAGFQGVEIQDLSAAPLPDMCAAARDADIAVVLVNADTGDAGAGGPGLSGVPGREQQFEVALARALESAEALSATYVHIGPSRVVPGAGPSDCMAVYLANVERALRWADGAAPKLVIEALNRQDAPDVLIGDLEVAASVARQFGPALGLIFDVYHVAKSGLDPLEAYRAHRDVVAHIQIADAPGRHEPGSGEVDFDRFFRGVLTLGYSGWFGAEYRPSVSGAASLAWLDEAQTLSGRFSS